MCILIEATRLIKPPYWTLTYGSPTMVSLDQPLPPPPRLVVYAMSLEGLRQTPLSCTCTDVKLLRAPPSTPS